MSEIKSLLNRNEAIEYTNYRYCSIVDVVSTEKPSHFYFSYSISVIFQLIQFFSCLVISFPLISSLFIDYYSMKWMQSFGVPIYLFGDGFDHIQFHKGLYPFSVMALILFLIFLIHFVCFIFRISSIIFGFCCQNNLEFNEWSQSDDWNDYIYQYFLEPSAFFGIKILFFPIFLIGWISSFIILIMIIVQLSLPYNPLDIPSTIISNNDIYNYSSIVNLQEIYIYFMINLFNFVFGYFTVSPFYSFWLKFRPSQWSDILRVFFMDMATNWIIIILSSLSSLCHDIIFLFFLLLLLLFIIFYLVILLIWFILCVPFSLLNRSLGWGCQIEGCNSLIENFHHLFLSFLLFVFNLGVNFRITIFYFHNLIVPYFPHTIFSKITSESNSPYLSYH